MGVVSAAADLAVLVFSLTIAVAAPMIDAQSVLPPGLHPAPLVELKRWCAAEYGDYLMARPPGFFRGLIWLRFLFFFVLFCTRGFDFFFFVSFCARGFDLTCMGFVISEAIAALKERTGSSSHAIAKYMEDKHGPSLPANYKKMLSIQLRGFAAKGKLVKVKASYKLSDAAKKEAPKAKPAAAKTVAAKPAKAAAKPKKSAAAAKPKKTAAAAAGTKRKAPEKKVVAKPKKSPAAKAKAKPKTVKSPASKKARKVAA